MNKKVVRILFSMLIIVTLGGCSIKNPFKKEEAETTDTAVQQVETEKKEDQKVVASLGDVLQQLETKYSLQRKDMDRDRGIQSEKELKSFNEGVDSSSKTLKKEYETKIETLNKSSQDKIKKDLDIELNRIKLEFENEKKKIDAEYNAEKARDSQIAQSGATLNSAEKNKANKLFNAEKQKAEKERNVNNKYALNIEIQSKAYESQKNKLNNIWTQFDMEIKNAKDLLDTNKKSINLKANESYNNKMLKLKNDIITTESMWQNLVASENEEILSLWKIEEDKYKNSVKDALKWRDNELKSLGL